MGCEDINKSLVSENIVASDSIPHGMRGYKCRRRKADDEGHEIASLMGCEDINYDSRHTARNLDA